MDKSLLEPIVFNEEEVIIPVEYRGRYYLLKEANGDAAAAFRSHATRCAKFGPDGKPIGAVGNVGDAEWILVSRCLFHRDNPNKDGSHRPVSEVEVRGFASAFLSDLFDRIKKISNLTGVDSSLEGLQKQKLELEADIKRLEQEEEDRKNASDSSKDGSA